MCFSVRITTWNGWNGTNEHPVFVLFNIHGKKSFSHRSQVNHVGKIIAKIATKSKISTVVDRIATWYSLPKRDPSYCRDDAKIMPSKFVHLHTHSHYSLLEALPKTKALLAHVKNLGQDAVAVTDNGTMYGAIEFYQKALDAEIKPIIGIDFYVAPDGRLLKRARIDTKPQRLVCLAETNEGYKNLIKLSSIGFLEGFYYKPRIDKDVLKEHAKGLIALSGGHMGEIDEFLKLDRLDEAKAAIKWYVEVFGEGNYFLELVDRPEIGEQEATNAKLIALGRELNVPIVATKNTFYLKPGDVEAWKILNCIKGQKTLETFERMQQFDYDASMVSGEYMEE